MKITFNPTTKVQAILPSENDRIIQNSSGNNIYLYGIEAGWQVKATFIRRDGFKIGLIAGVYDLDADDEYCYIIPIPSKATEVDKGLGVSILVYEPSGETFVQHSMVATAMYVYSSDNIIVPEELETVLYNALNLAVGNLSTNINTHKARIDNPHSVTKSQVGLGNADNTSDVDKPVSTAQQDALNEKADLVGGNTFEGNQNINGTVNAVGIVVSNASISSQLNKNNTKIVNLGNGSDSKDAVNKGQLDTGLALKENLSNKVNEVVVGGTTSQYVNAAALYAKFLTKVDKAFTIAGLDMQSGSITLSALKTAIGEATQSLSGLMSATDKQRLDALHAMLGVTSDADNVVNTINEIMEIFATYPEGADILTALNGKVDKVAGKQLSTNDLTDVLKNNYDVAYTHSQIESSNPHEVKFSELLQKPTTRDGYGITDVYTKPETYTQLEINNLLDNLSAVKGLKSTLLTPTELVNGSNIPTVSLTQNGAYVVFTATDTSTGEIDSDTVPVSTIITGKKFVFFDNQEIVFTIGETNSTFETSEDVTLKINLLYLDSENVQAVGVEFDGSLTNYLENQENVQSAINKLDEELKTTNDNKVDKVTGKGLSTEDYTTTEKSKLAGLTVNIPVETWDTETKTLALSDANKLFVCAYTGNQTLTIPTNASVVFPIGTMITFLLTGTHKVTFSGASGVYIMSIDSLVELKTQYGMASVIKTDTNTWQLVGAGVDLTNYYNKTQTQSLINDAILGLLGGSY